MLIRKKIKEADIQDYLAERINKAGKECWGRKWSDRYISNLPDYVIVCKGRVVFCELKRPGGSLREGQKLEGWRIERAGGTYVCCQSKQDIDDLMNRLLQDESHAKV